MRTFGAILACGMIASVLVVSRSSSGASAPPRAETMLDAYENVLAATRTWSMELAITSSIDRPTAGPGSPYRARGTVDRAVYRRDGDRVDVEVTRIAELDADRKPMTNKRIGVRSRAIVDGYYVRYERLPGKAVANAGVYAANGAKFLPNALALLVFASAFEGSIIDPQPTIAEICRKGNPPVVRDRQEPIDGHPCWVLDSTSKYGKCTVWFDPELGYWARKIVLDKGEDDIARDSRVGEGNFIPDSGKGNVTAKRYTYTVDGMKFARIGDVLFPTACRVTFRREYSDGSWNVVREDYTREKIDLKPDFKVGGAFAPELAEGAVLANKEDPQRPYSWRRGKPVPLAE